MYGKFFDTDNWLWRWIGKLPELFLLSIFWLICCIPAISIIPSCVALYDSIAHCVRGEEGGTYRRFWRTFWRELKQGIVISIIWLIVCWILYTGYQLILSQAENSTLWTVFSLIYLVSMTVPLGMILWLIPLQSRFTYSCLGVHINALTFALSYLPTTIVIAVMLLAAVTLLLNFPGMILLVPGVLTALQSWRIEKVLIQHMPKNEE